jgi:hypothetical protein
MSDAEQPNTREQSTPKPPPPWYSLTPWALAVGGLVWAAGVAATGLQAIKALPLDQAVPRTMGTLVGALIILGVLYGAAWLFALIVARRRVVLSTMFVVLVVGINGTLLAGSLSRTRAAAQHTRTMEALRELDEKNLENQRRRVESGNATVDLEAFDESQRALRAIAAGADERTRAGLAIIEAMNNDMRDAAADYNEAQARLFDRPLLDPFWMESLEDLEAARLDVRAFAAANERLLAASRYSADRMRAEFDARGVTDEAFISATIQGTRQSRGYQEGLELRRTDAAIAALLLEACDLYQSRWDAWEYDHDRQMILFESDEDVARWKAIYDRVQTVAAEQAELMRRAAELPPETPPPEVPGPGLSNPADDDGPGGGENPDTPPAP